MTTTYHTAISTGAVANAATFNAPLSTLDTQLTATQAEITAARDAYSTLDARLDAMIVAGGNVATLTNGAASAAQKVVTVDSTTGFIAGAYVAYMLVGGTLEYNSIDTVDSSTQLTMDTNIGTGGIANDTYISMISPSEYLAANAIPHSSTLTLVDAFEYVNAGTFSADAYGASVDAAAADNVTAVNAALTAINSAGGGVLSFGPGTYEFTAQSSLATILQVAGTGTRIIGAGIGKTVLKVADSSDDYAALIGGKTAGTDISGLEVAYLTIDHNITNNGFASDPVASGNTQMSVAVYTGTDISVHHVEIKNASSVNNIVVNGATCARVNISDNWIHDCGDNPDSTAHDASVIYTNASDVVIARNIIAATAIGDPGATTAIETHGLRTVVSENVISDWEFGANITGVYSADSTDIVVTKNVITGASIGIILWSYQYGAHTTGYGLNGVVVADNTIELDNLLVRAANTALGGIVMEANSDLDVTGLRITNNIIRTTLDASDPPTQQNSSSIGIGWYSTQDQTLSDSVISGNTIINFPTSGIRLSCKTTNVVVENNTLINCGSTLYTTLTYTYRLPVLVASSAISGLIFRNNYFADTNATTRNYHFFYFADSATWTCDDLQIVNNTFVTTGTGITYHIGMPTSNRGELKPYLAGAIANFKPLDNALQLFQPRSRVQDAVNECDWFLAADGYTWLREKRTTAAPTTGYWRAGEIVWNSAPASPGYMGWVCTVAGSPGTWRAFGPLAETAGTVVSGKCTAVETGGGAVHQTALTLTLTGANDIDLADGDHGAGVKVYDFPAGRILILGATMNGNATTNAAITGSYSIALGSVTAADDNDLTSTEADIIAKVTVTQGTDQAVHGFLAASAQFDGTSSALDLYVNAAIADGSNTGAGTIALTGTVTITWINLGDY